MTAPGDEPGESLLAVATGRFTAPSAAANVDDAVMSLDWPTVGA